MKKIILSVVVAAFAVAVQAGDNASCAEKAAAGSCCAAKQASTEAKGECPLTKQAKVSSKKAKASKQDVAKKPLKSPKAVADVRG